MEPNREGHAPCGGDLGKKELEADIALDLNLEDLFYDKKEQRVLAKSKNEFEWECAEEVAEQKKRSKTPPDQNRFANPFVRQGWRRYFRSLLLHCQAASCTIWFTAENDSDFGTYFDRTLVAFHLGQKRESEPFRRLDVLEAALRSRRFVVLGGPGSGKTWTSLRVAACLATGSDPAFAMSAYDAERTLLWQVATQIVSPARPCAGRLPDRCDVRRLQPTDIGSGFRRRMGKDRGDFVRRRKRQDLERFQELASNRTGTTYHPKS